MSGCFRSKPGPTLTANVIVPPSKVAVPVGRLVIWTAEESATAQFAVMLVGCAGGAGFDPVFATQANWAAAPLSVSVKLLPGPATIVWGPVVPSARTTWEPLSISALQGVRAGRGRVRDRASEGAGRTGTGSGGEIVDKQRGVRRPRGDELRPAGRCSMRSARPRSSGSPKRWPPIAAALGVYCWSCCASAARCKQQSGHANGWNHSRIHVRSFCLAITGKRRSSPTRSRQVATGAKAGRGAGAQSHHREEREGLAVELLDGSDRRMLATAQVNGPT